MHPPSVLRSTAAILALFAPLTSIRANEIARPASFRDYSDIPGTSAEQAVRVRGSEVAWADYAALKRDFPALKGFSNGQIDRWLVENFSYVGATQPALNGIRNSAIPTEPGKKLAVRPREWRRSAVLEAKGPDGEVLGVVDIKGFGHGAQSFHSTDLDIDRYRAIQDSPKDLDALRTKGHSDGLMSLGEAVAEVTRQKAAQMLFELDNQGFETVESYAILALPFDILKDDGKRIPAALYLRQANVGRASGLPVSTAIYTDPHGGRQQTDAGTAVDFGGVLIADPDLEPNFGASEGNERDPQLSSPWVWGHETALAWHRGDREAIRRHVAEMLAPIEKRHSTAPETEARAREDAERAAYFASLKDQPFNERLKLFKAWDKSRLKRIAHALDDRHYLVRVAAASDLALRTEPEALPLLDKALRDHDPQVRLAAAEALAGRTGPATLPLFETALQDPDILVRQYALRALSGRSDEGALRLVARALDDRDNNLRADAAETLKGEPSAAKDRMIRQALADRNWMVRQSAVHAMKARRDPESIPLLEKVMRDADSRVRSAVVEALLLRADAASLPLLRESLADSDVSIRALAAQGLAERQDPWGVQQIEKILASDDLNEKVRAARVLRYLEAPQSLPLYAAALKDPADEVRYAAIESLGRKSESGKSDSSYTQAFEIALRDPKPSLRAWGALGLRGMSDRSAIRLFETALHDPSVEVRGAAAEALRGRTAQPWLKLIEEALADPAPAVRLNAAHAVSATESDAVIPLLAKALEDPSQDVRKLALQSLVYRDDSASVSLLERALRDPRMSRLISGGLRIESDKKINPAAVPLLVQSARDADPSIRTEWSRALFKMVVSPPSCVAGTLRAIESSP